MGYSLVLKFKTKTERDKVLAHLEEHFKPVSEHFMLPPEVRGPVSDPAYHGDHENSLILGFDYHVLSDLDALHSLMVCEWAMINLGCELWYDGDEQWEPSKYVDDLGIFEFDYYCKLAGTMFAKKNAKKELSLIRENIELINLKWNELSKS